MSTKTIPAQTIKTCDCCGVVMNNGSSRQEGALVLKAHALDMQGSPCADATRKLDLCDSCLYAVGKSIDAAIAAKQGGATDPGRKEPHTFWPNSYAAGSDK